MLILNKIGEHFDWGVLLGKRSYGVGWNWKTYLWFALIFALPIANLFFMDEVWVFFFVIPGIIAWLVFVAGRLPYADAASDIPKIVHRAMVIAPIVVALSFGWGITQGQSALRSFDEPYTIEMKSRDKINRVLLRTFDKGLLVRDTAESRVEFIKRDEVVKLYRFAPPERKVPASCTWFGVHCPELPRVP